MTLSDVIKIMEARASLYPDVNMIVRNDVFRINKAPDRKYGIFAWTQQEHSTSMENDLMSYRFWLFYVDRLMENRRNEIEIQSVGIKTLDSLIRDVAQFDIIADGWSFNTFNQRFVDECAGVWCNVAFNVPISSLCPDMFPDFLRNDYNNDFLIF